MAFKKTKSSASNLRIADRKLSLESLEVRTMLTGSGLSTGAELMGPLRPEGHAPLDEFVAPADTDDGDQSSEFLAARTLEVFNLQSKPESNFTIFIDYDGHTSEGASWNNNYGIESIYHPPYDVDGDDSYFNETELDRMETAWRRTAEDFAAFDVNVTTIDPGVEALTRVGAADTRWGIRTVATRDTFAGCGCGGHAFIGSFTDDDDTAALVYNRGNGSLGETISHEVGHALRLSHDGLGGTTYYPGHGSGNTSWGAIMGAPFNERITQWDQAEYFGANNIGGGGNYSNGFRDLDVITTQNGFGYRDDDHGNSIATASELDVFGGTLLSGFGIIERNDDVDYFEFESPGGSFSLEFSPIEGRPNLDIWAGLYDANGTLVQESNPSNDQSASLNASLAAGTYYVKVDGVGSHGVYNSATDTVEDPFSAPWQNDPPTGYSDYGSLGQYWISGTVVANPDTFHVAGTNPDAIEGDGASSVAEFVVTRSSSVGSASVEYSVDALMPQIVGGTYPNVATAADFVGGTPSGVLNFADGEMSKTLSFEVVGDTVYEPDEFFVVRLSNASAGWDMAQSTAIGSIVTNESLVQLSSQSIIASPQPEGDPFTDSVTLRWRQVEFSSPNSDNWGLDNVSLSNSTFGDDFQAGVDDAQWGRIQNADVNNTFAGGSTSLFFTADGVREATTRIENPSPGDIVSFDLIFGDTINGGENADAGEDVVLEFSNDNGASWQLLERYDTEDYVAWTTIDVALPDEIATAGMTEYSFDIERFGDVSESATVDWQVSVAGFDNPVNGSDFVGGVLPTGVASFAPGDSIMPITVYVNRDINPELDEQFRVELASADSSNLISVNPIFESAVRTIVDDESSIGTRTETQFRWRQVASAGSTNSDAWALDNIVIASDGFSDDFDPNIDNSMWSNVTGTVANNFNGGTGNELFMNGGSPRLAVTRDLNLAIGDTIDFDLIVGDGDNGGSAAEDNEDVYLEMSLNGGFDWSLIRKYETDEYVAWTSVSEPVPDIAIGDVTSVAEGDSGQTIIEFTILRGGTTENFVIADWQVAGDGANPANAADFVGGVLPSGSVTFNPGEVATTVQVAVAADQIEEADESFVIQLVASSGGTIGLSEASGTILNDDEGISGDFDQDGLWNCGDIDLLTGMVAGGVYDSSFDMDGNGVLDIDDVGAWLDVGGMQNIGSSYLFGDANLDGVVDASDFNLWNGSKFTSNTAWCSGNFNADGVVDTSDFNLWNGNKFSASGLRDVSDSVPVFAPGYGAGESVIPAAATSVVGVFGETVKFEGPVEIQSARVQPVQSLTSLSARDRKSTDVGESESNSLDRLFAELDSWHH